MGETGAGVAVLFLLIGASKLIVASVITTLCLLHVLGTRILSRHWTALVVGLAVASAVSFVGAAADGTDLRSLVINMVFTGPPALVTATLWSLARPESDGYRSDKAMFAYVGLWVFLGFCAVLLPFSLI